MTLLNQLCSDLGHPFKNIDLLRQALTRQNAIDEKNIEAASISFQSLESFGDGVLSLVIKEFLLDKFPTITEAELHESVRLLANNEESALVSVGKKLKLENYVIKGMGETEMTNHMYADHMEAILGAIQRDCTYERARKVITKLFGDALEARCKQIQSVVVMPKPVVTRITTTTVTTSTVVPKGKQKVSTESKKTADPNPRFFAAIGKGKSSIDAQKYEEIIKGEKAKGVSINIQSASTVGNTALMVALKNGEYEKAALLVRYGATWSQTNKRNEGPDKIVTDKNIPNATVREIKAGRFTK